MGLVVVGLVALDRLAPGLHRSVVDERTDDELTTG
jgi:hypothetical protein